MKTRVEVTVVVVSDDDDEYSDLMEDIDEAVSNISGVESVNIGVGEPDD